MMRRLFAPNLFFSLLAVLLGLSLFSASASTDSYNGVAFHPFTIEPGGGCVATNEPSVGQIGNCDPVNLVFPGRTLPQTVNLLLLRGWTLLGLGGLQQLHFDDDTMVYQGAQLFFDDGLGRRYHVRLWQAPGASPAMTLGAVHHETGFLEHRIDLDWEAAEAFLAAQVCSPCGSTPVLTAQMEIQATDADGDPAKWRGWPNDGRATVAQVSPWPIVLCPEWLWLCRR